MSSTIMTVGFWKDAGERAFKSAVQGFAVGAGLLKIGSATVVQHVEIIGMPWAAALSTAGGMALASVVSSVLSADVRNNGTASLTKAVEAAPAEDRSL